MDRKTDMLMCITIGLTIFEVSLAGLALRWAWCFSFIAWQMVATYLIYIAVTRNTLILKLLIFALAANLPQLAVDWYHVRIVETLVYDYAWFRIIETPDYIMAGWGFGFLQLGYLVLRFKDKLRLPILTLVLTVGGTFVHCWYEEMAYQAGAWRYINASLLVHVSYWVIVSFALIIATICGIVAWLEQKSWIWWFIGGLVNGVLMFGYAALSVLLFC